MTTEPSFAASNWRPFLVAKRHLTACSHEVTRKGELGPCDRDAIAVRLEWAWAEAGEYGSAYPVCARHVTRVPGLMVPLDDIPGVLPFRVGGDVA